MLMLLFWMGIVFETPVVAFFLSKVGIVSHRFLARNRRYAVVVAFALGAIITPTFDPINQSLVALPIIVMYELGVWLAKLGGRKREARIEQACRGSRGQGHAKAESPQLSCRGARSVLTQALNAIGKSSAFPLSHLELAEGLCPGLRRGYRDCREGRPDSPDSACIDASLSGGYYLTSKRPSVRTAKCRLESGPQS